MFSSDIVPYLNKEKSITLDCRQIKKVNHFIDLIGIFFFDKWPINLTDQFQLQMQQCEKYQFRTKRKSFNSKSFKFPRHCDTNSLHNCNRGVKLYRLHIKNILFQQVSYQQDTVNETICKIVASQPILN